MHDTRNTTIADAPYSARNPRKGLHFTGHVSVDGKQWTKIGEADVPGAAGDLDAGVFTHRSAARFTGFSAN